MTERKFIIHPGVIEQDLASGTLSQEDKVRAKEALRIIGNTVHSAKNLIVVDDLPLSPKEWGRLAEPRLDGDVYVLREDDTVYIKDCVAPGDKVEIMGAYTRICVTWAANEAQRAGAVVYISKQATFDKDEG